MEKIERRWGYEEILVNNEEYCCKILRIEKGKGCSYHYHPVKKETWIPWGGSIRVNIKGSEFILTEPYTLNPSTPHTFYGLTEGAILEISTHHDDNDLVRLKEDVYE
uniref:Putative mannose-6-phosphate isomerase n=1 Tax=viral metagenome TaxID=1070528 RepID=A0A6M3K0F0_9ZZZZ